MRSGHSKTCKDLKSGGWRRVGVLDDCVGVRSHKLAQVANTQTVERELHALLIGKTREKNSANQISRLWRGSNDGEMKF